MKNSIKLESGMMLLNDYGDLHYLLVTKDGYRAIDTCGACIPFIQSDYVNAYIPVDYDELWEAVEGTKIIF